MTSARTATASPAVILCVDDEPVVLDSLRAELEQQFGAAVEIEVAQSGREALELLPGLQADGASVRVIICDWLMPGMKGDELLVCLHRQLPDARNILLTGQANAAAVGRVVNEAKLYRFIAKPWHRDDLALTVREALRSFESAERVRAQQIEIAQAQAAAERFVPRAFLACLGRERLADVQRGDLATKELSIFFSDIRGFTTMLETRDSAECVAWINDYLACMEPQIHDHGGCVENITGDGIVAVFESADHAVRAGVSCRVALSKLNHDRARGGEPPIEIGIGINTGKATLAVVGGCDRYKCSCVGDAANLAARVEGLTRRLGTMLITGSTRDRLQADEVTLRFVGRVRVRGRDAPTALYEVLDALPDDERHRKLASRDEVAGALELQTAGRLDEASAIFERIAARDPADAAVAWLIERLNDMRRDGVPDGWDGAFRLSSKS